MQPVIHQEIMRARTADPAPPRGLQDRRSEPGPVTGRGRLFRHGDQWTR
jgi:hypothetical protein